MVRPRVSVVRLTEGGRTEEPAYLDAAVERAVSLVGGWERFIKPGDRVFIKPNEFIAKPLESGFTTNPLLVIAVAKACRAAGAGSVVIGELNNRFQQNFAPYPEIHDYAELVDLGQMTHSHSGFTGAESLRFAVAVPDIINECDVFINMPGLRTHALTLMSNAMKNLMGLLPLGGTGAVHAFGLQADIVDINYHRPSDLVITDAIYSVENNFPPEGNPVKTDLVMAADNVVAADVVAAHVMGFCPEEIAYIPLAAERGMGPRSLAEIELSGDDLTAVVEAVHFSRAPADYTPFTDRITVLDSGVCAPCRRALASGLVWASHQPDFDAVKDLTVVVGPHSEQPAIKTKNVVLVGNCTYPWRHLGKQEHGCPPLASQTGAAILRTVRKPFRTSLCSIGTRQERLEEIIPRTAELGYDGIEIWSNHLEEYLERGGDFPGLRALLEEHRLAVSAVSPYFDFLGTPDTYRESIERARRFVEYARELKAPYVRVFVGKAASRTASHWQWTRVVGALKEVCAMGRPAGVGFILETHQNQLMDTTDTTLRLIRQVGAPNLKVNLDIHNLYALGEDPIAAMKRLHPHVVHVHAKNGRLEDGKWQYGVPLAESGKPGNMDYRAFLAALRAKGFRQFVSIEWFGPDFWEAARAEIAFLRSVLAETEE